MKEVKETTVNGKSYQVIPFTGRQACMLDRKVTSIMSSLYGTNNLVKDLFKLFAEMSDFEFEKLVQESLSQTTFVGKKSGEKSASLNGDGVWEHFKGRIQDLYELLYRVWEQNEFSPFMLVKSGD